MRVVVRDVMMVIYSSGNGGRTLLLRYGLIYDKGYNRSIKMCFIWTSAWVDMIWVLQS